MPYQTLTIPNAPKYTEGMSSPLNLFPGNPHLHFKTQTTASQTSNTHTKRTIVPRTTGSILSGILESMSFRRFSKKEEEPVEQNIETDFDTDPEHDSDYDLSDHDVFDFDVMDLWPKQYIKLNECGKGASGPTIYSILRPVLTAAFPDLKELDKVKPGSAIHNPRIRDLLPQVCVVKIFNQAVSARNEVKTLKRLKKESAKATLPFQLPTHLAADLKKYTWSSQSRIAGPEISVFIESFNMTTCPRLFLYHVFLQLGEALRFLHSRKPYPIVHLDVARRNVLVDCRNQSFKGLPNVVLIDFGDAEKCKYTPGHSRRLQFRDVGDFWDLLDVVKGEQQPDEGAFFDLDMEGYDKWTGKVDKSPELIMDALMREFGETAARRKEEEARVKENMEVVVKAMKSFDYIDEGIAETILEAAKTLRPQPTSG